MARPLLPPIPRELRAWLTGISKPAEVWFDSLQKLLSNLEAIRWELIDKTGSNITDIETRAHNDLQSLDAADAHPWDSITKTGSELQDIETRPHSQLTDVLGGVDQYHVMETERLELIALDALSTGMVAKTADYTYAARTITGTSGKIDVANGSGVSGEPTINLPTIITGGQKFGTDGTDNLEIESNGFPKLNGATTAWDDIQFNISSGRVGVANFPDWDTFTTNTAEYNFDVNDYIDLGTSELAHWWKEGSVVQPHLHVTLGVANSSGASRYAKYTAYIAYANIDAVWTETSLTAELEIPNGTSAMYNSKLNLGNLDLTGITIGAQAKVRIKRIAATGGTEYPNHTFITQLGFHAEKDTLGSREVTTK